MSIRLSGSGNPFGSSIDSSEITDGTIVAADLSTTLTNDLVHISGTETITGAKTFSDLLTGSASATITGTVTASTAFRAPDGSASVASYGFTNEVNTGIFKDVDDGTYAGIGITCKGVQKVSCFSNASGVGSLDINTGAGNFDVRIRGSGANSALFHTDPGNGRIGIMTEAPTTTLDVTGTLAISGNATFSGVLRMANSGLVGTPAITFVGDTGENTGLYLIGQNNLGVSANGAKVLDISTTGLGVTGTVISTGAITATGNIASSAANTYTSGTATNYWSTVHSNGLALRSSSIISWNAFDNLLTNGAGTWTIQCNNATAFNLDANQIAGPTAGGVSAPTFSFLSDTNTGMYRIGADNLGLAVGGSKILDLASTSFTSTVPYLASAGSAGTPSVGFSGDTNTGMYSVGGDTIGFSTGGTRRAYIDNNNFAIEGLPKFLGTNSTGAGTPLLGTNCPAGTLSAPNTWIKIVTAAGTEAYVPCWA